MNLPSDQHASELLDVFFESAEELLEGMNATGLALEANPADGEQLRHVRRAVHTLKGDAAACGFRELSELAHHLEDALTPELARDNSSEIAAMVLTATDTFKEMLAAYRANVPLPTGEIVRELVQRLVRKSASPSSGSSGDSQVPWTEYERLVIAQACGRGEYVYRIAMHLDPHAPFSPVAFELARKALNDAGRVLALRPQDGASPTHGLIEAALSSSHPLEWIRQKCRVPSVVEKLSVERIDAPHTANQDVLQVLLEAEAKATAQAASPDRAAGRDFTQIPDRRSRERLGANPAQSAVESNLRVDAARIDAVMNLVGELIIGKSMLQRTVGEFDRRHPKDPLRGRFSDALAFQSRILGELQKSVMKIRMVPVEQLFRRFPRIVRDVAKLTNKDIALEVSGQNTDLDKGILDALGDPLAHLVRNAADHGIEAPAERRVAGKFERGTIRINAYHEGDQVVIEVSDDGKGLDRDKIIRRAIQRKIFTVDEAARLSDSEALQLIFRPGFSTKDEVTEISGRGVGLDVVKSVLENMKGSVEVSSESGRGTTFKLLVPLTLASIQALLFRADGRLYAVPLASVIEITRLNSDEIHLVDNREVIQLRKQILPLVRLARSNPDLTVAHSRRLFVVILGLAGRRFGLVVDRLMGEEELVIKALEDNLVTSPLISGASILGDGTVVLVLNVTALAPQPSKSAILGEAL